LVSDTRKTGSRFVVCALYRFVRVDEAEAMREPLLELMREHHIKGTLLLATEGINGTVAGDRTAIDTLLAALKNDSRFADLTHKESYTDEMPFLRAKVKLKKEIVTLGVAGIDPEKAVSMIVNGFCKEVFRELPMEFAVEAGKLLEVSLEGAVG